MTSNVVAINLDLVLAEGRAELTPDMVKQALEQLGVVSRVALEAYRQKSSEGLQDTVWLEMYLGDDEWTVSGLTKPLRPSQLAYMRKHGVCVNLRCDCADDDECSIGIPEAIGHSFASNAVFISEQGFAVDMTRFDHEYVTQDEHSSDLITLEFKIPSNEAFRSLK